MGKHDCFDTLIREDVVFRWLWGLLARASWGPFLHVLRSLYTFKISSLFGIFLRIFESKLFPQYFKIVLTLNRLMKVLIFWRYKCPLAVKVSYFRHLCVAYEIPSLLALLATKKLHNALVDFDPGILSRQDRHYLNLDSLFSSRFLNFPELFLIFWE